MKVFPISSKFLLLIFGFLFLISCSNCKKDCDAVSANFTQELHPAFMLRPGEIDTVVLTAVSDDADTYEWLFGNNQMDGGNNSTGRIIIMNPPTSTDLTYNNIAQLNIKKEDNQCSLTQDIQFEGRLDELRVASYFGTDQNGVTALYSAVFDGQFVEVKEPFPFKIPEASNVPFGGTLEIDEESGLLFGAPVSVVARCYPNSSNFALVNSPMASSILGMVLDVPNQKVYYLADNFGQFSDVQVLDLKTDILSVLENSTAGSNSSKLALSHNSVVWSIDDQNGLFNVYDLDNKDVIHTVSIQNIHPESPVASDRRNGEVYYADQENFCNIYKFDPSDPDKTPKLVVTAAARGVISGIDIDEKANEIIWSDPSTDIIWRAPLDRPANKTMLLDGKKFGIKPSAVTVGNFFR